MDFEDESELCESKGTPDIPGGDIPGEIFGVSTFPISESNVSAWLMVHLARIAVTSNSYTTYSPDCLSKFHARRASDRDGKSRSNYQTYHFERNFPQDYTQMCRALQQF